MDTALSLVGLPVADGTLMDAVVVQPAETGPWPGIIYPFESYGLTDHMVQRATETAAQRYGAWAGSINHWEAYIRSLSLTEQTPPSDPTPAGNIRVEGTALDHLDTLQAPVLVMPALRSASRSDESPIEAGLRKLGKPFEGPEDPTSRTGFGNPDLPRAYHA